MSYSNLIEIAKYLEEFENQNISEFSIDKFAFWLVSRIGKSPRMASELDTTESAIHQQPPNIQISILIGRMYKYARMYSKKILSSTKLKGLDDYTFMATLMFRESMTKSELIHHNLMDSTTSGTDIIKRLLTLNYIEVFDDEHDKRSKRVRITDAGKRIMFAVFNEMDFVSTIITGDLNDGEKLYLLEYLKKLELFHNGIYHHDRKKSIEAINKKYFS